MSENQEVIQVGRFEINGFDHDQEVGFSLEVNDYDTTIYLSKEEVQRLVEFLNNQLNSLK